MKKLQDSTIPGVIVIEGHVQGLSNTRALGVQGIPVIVVDKSNCIARYSKYCFGFFKCPDYSSDEFVPFLIELALKRDLKGWMLLPSNDHAVWSIANHREELSLVFKIVTPELSVVEQIYDKSKLLAVAEQCNVEIPATTYLKSAMDEVKRVAFPLITKGRQGLSFYKATGRKVFLAKNSVELASQLKQIESVFPIENTFTQELIPFDGKNKTISFTAFCIDGEIKTFWIGVKLREHPIRFGTATYAKSISCEPLIDINRRLIAALNYSGVCEVEYLFDPRDNKYKLIEVNARTWLWVGLARKCGVDYATILYRNANNLEVNYPQEYTISIGWINYITDTVFSLIALVKGKLSIKDYLNTLTEKKTDAFFSVKDIKPSIMFILLSVYIAIKRS